MRNFLQDHFSIPLLAALFPVVNDAVKLGFDFKTLVLVAAVAVCFSAIQAAHEVGMAFVAGKFPGPIPMPSPPPATIPKQ